MGTSTNLKKEATRIADAIVELVERRGGPVTLATVHNIPGFATKTAPFWRYAFKPDAHTFKADAKKIIIWDGMSKAGRVALEEVLSEHRVAVETVPRLIYFLQGACIEDKEWLPIALIPATAANLDTPHFLMRLPLDWQDSILARAAAEGRPDFRSLKPSPAGFSAG
jgi:hypothetical protein